MNIRIDTIRAVVFIDVEAEVGFFAEEVISFIHFLDSWRDCGTWGVCGFQIFGDFIADIETDLISKAERTHWHAEIEE